MNQPTRARRVNGAALRPAHLAGLLLCGTLAVTPGNLKAQTASRAIAAADWREVIDHPGLSDRERAGARFASQHLPIELFQPLSGEEQRALLRYAEDHSDGDPSFVLCWQQGTSEARARPFLEIEYAGKVVKQTTESRQPVSIGTAFQASDSDHWNRTAFNGSGQGTQGLPITLTWSIVPDGTIIPGSEVAGEGSNEPSNLRAWLAGIYGGSATAPAADQPWFPIFQAVFDNISDKTGVRYLYEPNDDANTLSSSSSGEGVLGVRGDIRISGHELDGNFNVLAYNYFPDYAEMVIDTADSFYNDTANNSRKLRNVLEHEHNHGLGLSHVCPVDNTKLMEPYINVGFVGIQFDEIFTIQRLYGDFLEVHGSERNNDSFATATPVSAPLGVPFVAEWAGIDDNTDTDYFQFSVPAGSQLSVRVLPSTDTYLEGEQNLFTGACTAGTTFDSSDLQNLGLTVYAPDQATVLGSATSEPAGSIEAVSNLIIDTAGTHYARVAGSGANLNQLYRLEINVSGSSYAIQLAAADVTGELLPVANGAPDPGETIALSVALQNVGQEAAQDLTATLSGPAGFQGFDVVQSYGTLAPGDSRTADFVFALDGQCGDLFSLSLDLDTGGQDAGQLPVELLLGAETDLLTEDFESGGGLPAGWSSSESGQGNVWTIVASPSHPGQLSAFAPNTSKSGESFLTSPTLTVNGSPGTLRLAHFYDTEANWDGGVLEIKIGGGSWQDILDAGGSFLSGAYTGPLNSGPGAKNPLEGRNAWSGDSGGYITSEVALPPVAAGQTIQFRMVLATDNRVDANGWYIERVDLSEFACETGSPALTLSSADPSMSEYDSASDTALVTVSAPLPVNQEIPVTLDVDGSADPALDLTGLRDLTLMPGSSSTSLVLRAVSDSIVEGNETLIITSPEAAGSVLITLLDTPYGQLASATIGTIGAVNPFDDFDLDGSINVEEILFGTDLNSALSVPGFALQPEGDDFKLPALYGSLPAGVVAVGESSTDFLNWSTNEVSTQPDGFVIPGSDVRRFLRLRYSVEENAP